MKKQDYLVLGVLGLLVVMLTAFWQTSPGYMDADYYYVTAMRIASGKGMTEPFLWNYLGDFADIVHPSHAFWMPLSTFIGALGMVIRRETTYLAARAGFVVLAGTIPPLTAQISWKLSKQRAPALMAGLLACFSAFYLAYLPVTDSFSPLMVLGSFYVLLLDKQDRTAKYFLLGLVSGGMHLARAEGILWIVLAMIWVGLQSRERGKALSFLLAGYLLVMGPWMVRNLQAFNHPLGKGGSHSLWLVDYDQLFVYPPEELNFSHWWARGIPAILKDRVWALSINAKTALAVQGQIFLVPLIFWGGLKLRAIQRVRWGIFSWCSLFGLMTVVFPFQGARGSFFHGGAALQPLIWAVAAAGLDDFIQWGEKNRSWNPEQGWKILGTGLIVISMSLSFYLVKIRVIGDNFQVARWNQSYRNFTEMEEYLKKAGAKDDDVIMVNNPPGYYAANKRAAVVVPDSTTDELFEAAGKYEVEYLIIDTNYPQQLKDLYENPNSQAGLIYLGTNENARFYKFTDDSQ